MKVRRIILTAILMLMISTGMALAITPAGTVISNTATSSYQGPSGPLNIKSNTVMLSVSQMYGIDISPNGTTAPNDQGSVSFAAVAGTAYLPYVLRNTGNGSDTYTLTPKNLSGVGDGGDLKTIRIYIDTNGDGKHQAGEPLYNNASPPGVAGGAVLYLLVAGEVPIAATGDILVNIEGASTGDNTLTDTDNVGRVALSSTGFVNATKSSTKTNMYIGDTDVFRIDFGNHGFFNVRGANMTACDFNADGVAEPMRGMLVSDPLPSFMAYVPGTAVGNPLNGFPVFMGSDGLWKTTDSAPGIGTVTKVGFYIPENLAGNVLAPSQTGFFTFNVIVVPAAPPCQVSNIATVYFDEGLGDKKFDTNRIFINILPRPSISVEDTDFVADDLTTVDHAAAGSCISFINQAVNTGGAPDSIEIQFDSAASSGIPAGATVSFYDMSGFPLHDLDGDMHPETGLLAAGGSLRFETRVCLPPLVVAANINVVVRGYSEADKTVTDPTTDRILNDNPVGVQVKVMVAVHGGGTSQDDLKNSRLVVYQYNGSGAVVAARYFRTDANGYVAFDDNGTSYPLYNYLATGFSYRLGVVNEIGGFSYFISPDIYKSDFDDPKLVVPGDSVTRGDITVKVMPNGTKLLIAPLDPAGYVFDKNTNAKVDRACVYFMKCTDGSCASFAPVDPSLLDFYPDGVTPQENPQLSGPTDGAGNNVGKGAGAFEFKYKAYNPALYDGWYFVMVDYGCALPNADHTLPLKYDPVNLNSGAVWNPLSGSVYIGEKFNITSAFPAASLLKIPVGRDSALKPIQVKKSVNATTAMTGDIIAFTIDVTNPNTLTTSYAATVIDMMPAGIRYKSGSGLLDGKKSEPVITAGGATLSWAVGDIPPGKSVQIKFLAYVGVNAAEGNKINNATTVSWMEASRTTSFGSLTGSATFFVKKGVFSEKAYIIGKVYKDANDNNIQDPDEELVKGVKIYMEDGRYAVTDSEGKYHMDNIEVGTHVLKIDMTSLPRGFVPAITCVRNMDDAGSLFADLFPGDMYDGVFRLVKAAVSAEAGVKTPPALVASKGIDAIMTDPSDDTMVVRHRLMIKNVSASTVFETRYSEGPDDMPIDGTIYIDGAPFPGQKPAEGGFALSFPVTEAGREMALTYNTRLPEASPASQPRLRYKVMPASEDSEADVTSTLYFYTTGPGKYVISIPTAAPGHKVTQPEKADILKIIDALRKYGYEHISIITKPGGSDDVSNLLRDGLINMDKVSADIMPEAPAQTASGAPVNAAPEVEPVESGGTKVMLMPMSPKSDVPVSLPGKLAKGMYSLHMTGVGIGVGDGIHDVKMFMKLPAGLSYIASTAVSAGKPLDVVLKSEYFIIGPGPDSTVSGDIAANFFVMDEIAMTGIPFAVFAKDASDKPVMIDSQYFSGLSDKAMEVYTGERKPKKSGKQRLKSVSEWRILSPEADITAASAQIDVKVAMPEGETFTVKVNGKEVDAKLIGENAVDSANGTLCVTYVGVQLVPGANVITLEGSGGVMDKKTVSLSGEVAGFTYTVAPDMPPADGKTPVYVTIELKDAKGAAVSQGGYIEVKVDKGDVFDYEKDTYNREQTDIIKLKVVAGRAVMRLSPSSTTDTRTISVKLDKLVQRDIDIRWYPERRDWIMAGRVEAGVGFFNKQKGNPPASEMPFDHTEGNKEVEISGGAFAKGTIKDYTVTMRYKEKKDDNVILQQNVPSTEESQYYPVYGDSSEQYFEAQSKDRIYARAERGLSFLMYGDYNTGFGSGLEFNRYDRTLSGGLLNVEEYKKYLVRSFVSYNDQSMTRQTIPGKGMSGPYFLNRKSLIEFSEKVWIEVRDRYNKNIIKDKKQLTRYTDYQINYEEGWIIFIEPVRAFDDNFNPVMIQVVFESKDMASQNLMYGVRAEKYFFNGRLRVGASGTHEDNPVHPVQMAGVDAVWETPNLKVAAEAATTDNFNQTDYKAATGNAFRIEGEYHKDDNSVRAFYKKVTKGFQNPSATTADTGYETYGANGQMVLNDKRTTVRAEVMSEHRDMDRFTSSFSVEQKILKSISANAGLRWNREKSDAGTLENLLAIYGVTFTPMDSLGLSVGREEVITGQSDSSYYPTKTIAKINYAITKKISAFVQSELQEQKDKNQLVTSVGLEGRLGDNTTATAKYSIDDSTSGWRNQAHFGINHTIPVSPGLIVEGGAESNITLSGKADETTDFTSIRAGFTYTQKENMKLAARYEIRIGRHNLDHLATIGGSLKIREDLTVFINERYFNSLYKENDLQLGAAYRPVRNDNLNALFKIRWQQRYAEIDENRLIGSVNVNYRYDKTTQIMAQYAFKSVFVRGTGDTFTDMYRVRVVKDITSYLEGSVHVGVMRQHNTGTGTLAWGPEIGVKVVKNLWLSVGYNFSGFKDKDFDEADSWAKGAYVKVRYKFDENTVKGVMKMIGVGGEDQMQGLGVKG